MKKISDNRITRIFMAYIFQGYPYKAVIAKRDAVGISFYKTKAKIVREPEGNRFATVRHGELKYPKNSKCRSGKTFYLYEAEESKLFPLNIKTLIEERELDVIADDELSSKRARDEGAINKYKPDKQGIWDQWGNFITMAVFMTFMVIYLWQFQGMVAKTASLANKNAATYEEGMKHQEKSLDKLENIARLLAEKEELEHKNSGEEINPPPPG